LFFKIYFSVVKKSSLRVHRRRRDVRILRGTIRRRVVAIVSSSSSDRSGSGTVVFRRPNLCRRNGSATRTVWRRTPLQCPFSACECGQKPIGLIQLLLGVIIIHIINFLWRLGTSCLRHTQSRIKDPEGRGETTHYNNIGGLLKQSCYLYKSFYALTICFIEVFDKSEDGF